MLLFGSTAALLQLGPSAEDPETAILSASPTLIYMISPSRSQRYLIRLFIEFLGLAPGGQNEQMAL